MCANSNVFGASPKVWLDCYIDHTFIVDVKGYRKVEGESDLLSELLEPNDVGDGL